MLDSPHPVSYQFAKQRAAGNPRKLGSLIGIPELTQPWSLPTLRRLSFQVSHGAVPMSGQSVIDQPTSSKWRPRSLSLRPRRTRPSWQLATLLITLCAWGGCKLVDEQKLSGKSPLAALEKQTDQAHLEVVFVRIPQPDYEAAQQLWEEIDELAIPAEQRRRLTQNGFRAGVLGSRLPPRIEAIMQSAHNAESSSGVESPQTPDGVAIGATRQQMFLRRGQRGEVIASSVQPEFHVLKFERGEIHGRTYRDGQAQFSVKAAPTDDQRVRLYLLPEVHYGALRNRYVPGDGMFRLDTSRQKQTFDELGLEADLVAGQILVIGSQPGQPGSLGHRFFKEQAADKSITKLLMIRISEIGSDELHIQDTSESMDE